MISQIDGSWAQAEAGSTREAGGELGRNEFLQLLVAQLQHQDPLNPSEPEKFAAQLAQFSSLEQLVSINEGLSESRRSEALMAEASNRATAVSLIGREALAPGNRVVLGAGGAETLTAAVGGNGGSGTLRLLDARGATVAEARLPYLSPGRQEIPVGEFFPDVPDGNYGVEIGLVGGDGEAVPVDTFTRYEITGIRLTPDGIVLLSGEETVPLTDVVEVMSSP